MHKSSLFVVAAASAALASCSGNLGGGGTSGIGGLNGPVAPNVAQPYAAPTPLDRERSLEDSIAYLPTTTSLTLPSVSGFTIAINLAAPTPIPSGYVPSPAASAGASATALPFSNGHAGSHRGASSVPPPPPLPAPVASGSPAAAGGVVFRGLGMHRTLAIAGVLVAVNATATPTAGPSPAPGVDASGASSDTGAQGSAAPSAPPSGASASASPGASPAATTTPAPKTTPRPRPTHRPSPKPSPSGPVVEFKETIYPDYAPKPPSPKIVSPVSRVALVRGYLKMPVDLTLASLAAVSFTIPTGEITPGRGFTVAFYDERKKKHPRLILADTAAVVTKNVVSGTSDDILQLDAGNPYSFVLFADALPPSPPPGGTYSGPGSQGIPGQPGQPGVPGAATPYPGTSAYPGTTPFPGTTGYPAQPPAGYNQPYGTPTLTATIPPSYPTFPAQ